MATSFIEIFGAGTVNDPICEEILIKNPRVMYAPIVGSLFPAEIR
jgi:hypothetical protein